MVKRKPRERSKRPGGTDSSVFSMNWVPTMGFTTADPKGYDFSYREIWHTENDYYQKSIPEYQEHTSIVTAVVVVWGRQPRPFVVERRVLSSRQQTGAQKEKINKLFQIVDFFSA
jgi:hypothetical protein